DFTFSSPVDENISRTTYFDRCWPNSEHTARFELEPIFIDGDQAIVRYQGTSTDGSRFRNVEVFTIAGGKVKHVQVYFGTDTAETVDQQEVEATVQAWARAIERKDVAAVTSHFAENSVSFLLAPPLVADEALEKNLRDWFATFEGPLGHEIAQLRVTTGGGSCAIAHGLIHLTGTKTDGTATHIWYRLTLGLTKTVRAWKIFHTHESVPFHMDGPQRAATDLSL
ncbi:MAG: hypothetical protein EOP85_22235, partial [Verrucomicrobiaceae bacterium]